MAPRGKPFPPGVSGNPAGRPPKERALTTILETAGNSTLTTSEGKHVARKRITAGLLWELASTGRATFPDGTVLEADPADWLAAVKWLYQHIDGPPKQAMELSGPDDGPLVIRVEYVNDWRQAS